MQSEAERIAAGLSEAQKRCVLWFTEWPNYQDWVARGAGTGNLNTRQVVDRLGLTQCWRRAGVEKRYMRRLSHVGLAVREVLTRPPA